MIERDINEIMAETAPSQNVEEPSFDPGAIREVALGMAEERAPMQFDAEPASAIKDVARRMAQQRRDELASSMLIAQEMDPDKAAEAKRLGDALGLGQDIAYRNMEALRKQDALDRLATQEFMRRNPRLTQMMQDPTFASEAQDDVKTLSGIEGFFMDLAIFMQTGSTPGMRAGFERGELAVERGRIGTRTMIEGVQPEDVDRLRAINARMRELGNVGFLGATTEVIAQNLASLRTIGTTAAGGAAVGSFVGPAGTVIGGGLGATAGVIASTGELEAGNLYADLLERGVSDDVAIPTAIAGGFLNGIIEVAGMKVAAKPFQALASKYIKQAVNEAVVRPTARRALAQAGKAYLAQVAAEGGEEALQEIVNIAGEEIALAAEGIDSETDMQSAMGRVVDSFVQGVMGSALLGGIGPGANLYVDLKRASGAERQQQFFTDLSTGATGSRLRARDPGAFERFIEAQANGTQADTIYVDAQQAQNVLRQSGLTPAQVDELVPGLRTQLAQELPINGDVLIPTARFASTLAGTDVGNAMMPHMRLSPDAMSAVEAAEFESRRQELTAQAEQILAEKQDAQATFVDEARAIEDRIFSEVVATGAMDEKAARANAQFVRDFYVTQAARMGVTPAQMQERFPYRVQGDGMAAPLEQADQFDQSGQRRTDTPEFREWSREAPVVQGAATDFSTGSSFVGKAYHGTPVGDIEAFDPLAPSRFRKELERGMGAVWFGAEPATATNFAGRDGSIYPVYVTMQNPLVVDAAKEAQPDLYVRLPGGQMVYDIQYIKGAAIARAKREGHDGVVFVNAYDGAPVGGNATIYAMFNPLDIKSQLNRGTFSRATANILDQAARLDADYLAAVERGDMATAQRMVDEAARTAGYTIEVEHQTNELFTEFKAGELGFHVGVNIPEGMLGQRTMQLRAQIENPLRMNDLGVWSADRVIYSLPDSLITDRQRSKLLEEIPEEMQTGSPESGDMFAYYEALAPIREFLMSKGYDGIVYRNEAEGFNDSYIAFNPEQLKSADPVTRDESGNVVPLSRRFDITSAKVFEQAAMSTRVPSAKGMEMAALDEMLLANWEAMKGNDKLIAGNLAKIKELKIPIKLDETKSPTEQLEQFMEAVADNLDYLYEQMDPELRERAKLWYVGARRIAEWLSARYGITDMQAAAMLAVLSPQKNWFENVSMTDRIGDILTAARSERWSPKMEQNFRRMVEAVRAQISVTERQIEDNKRPTKPKEPLKEESEEVFKERKKKFDGLRARRKKQYEADVAEWDAQLREYEDQLAELQETGESTAMLRADIAAHRRDRPKAVRMPGRQMAETKEQFNKRVEEYATDYAEWKDRSARLEKMLDSKRKRLEYLETLSTSPRMKGMREGTLGDLLKKRDLELAAMFVRMFDEEHNSRTFAIITPEGGMAGPSMGALGPMSMRWGSYSTIQKAISVFEDGRVENVHHQIGKAHKVRNFYNNIFDPTNVNAATIDTHAIAAAFLMPLAASDEMVGWGLGSGVSDAKLGLHGGYPILFEAYKRAAERRGILAREEQSITWEAIRGLFVAAEKKTLKPIIAEEWAKYMRGEQTLDATRANVFKLASGIKTPEWVAQATDLPVGSTYSGSSRELMDAMAPEVRKQMQQPTRMMFEIAPDPRNKTLTEAWNALSTERRFEISRSVAGKIVPRVLEEFGVSGAFEEQIGGWEGATNMSFALTIPTTRMVPQLSEALRYVLSQESIFSISAEQFYGSKRGGLIKIELQPGTTPDEIADLYETKLYPVTKVGHSTVGSSMIIGLGEDVDAGEMARTIEQAIGDDPLIVDIAYGEAWSLDDKQEIEQPAGAATSADVPATGEPEAAVKGAAVDKGRPAKVDERRRLDALRSEASKLVEREFGILEQAARGPARGGFDPSRLTTILNKTADLSTFLHETAHFYLTAYASLAADPAAPAQVRADMDELLKWFGVADVATWNAMTVDQQRKYHEQFAYSFEVYLFEGKSPSIEMQGLFERFSGWLKRIYRSIRDDLNAIYRREFGKDLPILTPEVRGVFDRMLATEEQIKRQAAVNEMKPMFQTQAESGMPDAEWAAYQAMQQEALEASVTDMTKASLRQMQWLSGARDRILRDMQRKHDALRKETRKEVEQEVKRDPVYRAMTYLRTGTFVDSDGAEAKVEGPHRLRMEAVRELYKGMVSPAEVETFRATGMRVPPVAPDIAKLGTGGRGMMGVEGLDPDLVAETFGFDSGDQMIRALIDAKPIKEEIDARTDALMLKRHGDMNDPKAREVEVQKALHNEARARFVAVELRHIAKATQPVRVMLEAAKQVARDLIAGKVIRDVKPQDFIAAEARAARDAVRIGAPVDPEAVGRAAYTRAYNEAAAVGAPEDVRVAGATEAAAEATRKAQERADEIRRQYGADTQQALIRAKRAQLYQNQLAAEALRVREEIDKAVKYLRKVLRDENVKRMGAAYADQIAAILARFDLRPMSQAEMNRRTSLVAWLESLKDSGLEPDLAPEIIDEARRTPWKQLTVTQFRDVVDAVKQIEFIGKNERKIQLAQEKAEFEGVRDEIVKSVKENAAGRVVLPRSPTTGIGRTAEFLRTQFASHLKAASIARILDGGKDDGPVWRYLIRSANERADMETKMRAEASVKLADILKPLFDGGRMGGKGTYFESVGRSFNRESRIAIALNMGNEGNQQRLLDGEGWTMEQVQPILESLTESDWKVVQSVWDFLETYRPLIAEKERRLYGKEPNWVKPMPLTVRTANGKELTLQGGYYPIKYDPRASERAETAEQAEEAKNMLRGAYTAATTRRSFTKSRVKEVSDRPLLYTMAGVFNGVNEVVHDLAWHEWLIQANRLMRAQSFDEVVRTTYGPEFKSVLTTWIKDVAAGERGVDNAGEAALGMLRRSVSAAGLGFNVMSAALQITGFNQSIVRVGAKWIGKGVAQTVSDPKRAFTEVNEKSTFMAERARTQFRELNEVRNLVRDESAAQRRLRLGTYFLMMRMQRMVDVPTWWGSYEKALAAGKDDRTAVALADQAVKDSQGSGMLMDLSKVERGGPALKLFTVFYGYMNTVFNMAAVQTMTPRSRGKLAADYAMLFVVPVVMSQAIKSALTPGADDPEDEDLGQVARNLAAEELSYLMGTMVIAREFAYVGDIILGADTARRGYEGPAGLRLIGETGKFATQAAQGEFDRAFRKSAVNLLGAVTGLPAAQINRTLDGLEALAEGEAEGVTAPLAPLTGIRR